MNICVARVLRYQPFGFATFMNQESELEDEKSLLMELRLI